jgi:hypothetical protein
LYAYALMDNHFHLFLATPRANLAEAMQYLNGSYAAYFNVRHERKGHLFENRYHAILVETQGHYTEVSRYIHLNPVRAGLCGRPEDYVWSSYIGYHTGRKHSPWMNYERVLAEFGEGKLAQKRYREFVADGVGKKLAPPWMHAIGGWIFGSPTFAAKTYALLAKESKGGRSESRAAQGSPGIDATLDEIARAVCAHFHITEEQLRVRGELKTRLPRTVCTVIARERAGLSLKAIGAYLEVTSLGSITHVVKRSRARMTADRRFGKAIDDISHKLESNKGVRPALFKRHEGSIGAIR